MSESPPCLGVGFSLHANAEFIELLRPLIEEDAEYFEIGPESLCRPTADGLEPNDYFHFFAELKRRSKRPFVGHGVAFSLGSDPNTKQEEQRFALWLEGLKLVQDEFDLSWFSDHLGWVFSKGLNPIFPLPLPMTIESADRVAHRLKEIQRIVPQTAFENGADFFRFGPLGLEASFWNTICDRAQSSLILDLHNLYTESLNLGFDPGKVIAELNLNHVVQIHLSGGSESEASWLKSGRVFRIDGHDGPIPEEVWKLLDEVLPHCHALSGILVERLDGTVTSHDVPLLREEMRRAKIALASRKLRSKRQQLESPPLPLGSGLSELQERFVTLITDSNSYEALLSSKLGPGAQEATRYVEADGYRLTSLIVRKLRFERLCRGDAEFLSSLEREPETLLASFDAYAKEIPQNSLFPGDEAQAYRAWLKQK